MIKRLCVFLLVILFLNISPAIAETAKPSYLHAFYPAYATYTPDMEKFIQQLDSISFAWSRMEYQNDVYINTVKGLNGNTFYYPQDYMEPVRYAKSMNKPIQLSIYSGKETAEAILTNETNRNKAVNLIIDQMTKTVTEVMSSNPAITPIPDPAPTPEASPGTSPSPTPQASSTPAASITPDITATPEPYYYDGIVIDFEGLKKTNRDGSPLLFDGKPVSHYFNLFLKDLRSRLSAIGKKLFVAVNPSKFYNGYDYKAIAETADRMILMAHDYDPSSVLKKFEAERYYEYDVLAPTYSVAPSNEIKIAVNDVKAKLGSATLCKKVLLQLLFDSAQWQYPLEDINEWGALDDNTPSIEGKSAPKYEKIKARIDNLDGAAQNFIHGYNNLLECPYITYYNPTEKLFNIIVYDNSKSMASKVKCAAYAGFGGLSIWAFGNISDYTDKSGLAYGLNIWDKILESTNNKALWNGTLQNTTRGKAVKFTDKKFEAVIRDVLQKPTDSIYEGDLLEIDRIRIPANTSPKLTDIKYLKNLEFLDASDNAIVDLATIGSLTKLKALYLSRSKIKDIKPLAKLKGLEILSLKTNNISDLTPLSGLAKLRKLYLSENKISSVKPLSKLVNIQELYLKKNSITDISPLKDMKVMYDLNADSNRISNLKVLEGLSRLRYLDLRNNIIRDATPLNNLECAYKL